MKKKKAYSTNFIIGAVITGIVLVMIIIGFIHTPYDITKMNSAVKLAPPSLKHLMGCDNFGRDIFSRVLKGMGNTFVIAFAMAILGLVLCFVYRKMTGTKR